MKKICFLIGNLDHSGGTERVTAIIANNLFKREKYEIFILSLIGGNQPFFKLDESIHTYSLFSYKVSMKVNFIRAIWRIRKFAIHHKIDTLIVVDSISCVFTVPALYGLDIKHICWEHFNFNVNLGVKFRDIGRKWAAKYCNYVVTITKRDEELWRAGLKYINAEIVPIFNPVPFEFNDHKPSLDFKVVLAVGRLTYQKGFDLLLLAWQEVCEKNTDWLLKIVGSGEDEVKLKELATELGINSRVEFIPTTNDIDSYYKSASFYCLSSRFEGFGMVLLEAQAYGLPLISFDCDAGPSDIIINGKNGLLVEVDKSLTEALLKQINISEIDYDKQIENSKLLIHRFDKTEIIDLWEKVI